MPRIVSTSSCSIFNLAFQRKSVRATKSPCRSRMYSTIAMTSKKNTPRIARPKVDLRGRNRRSETQSRIDEWEEFVLRRGMLTRRRQCSRRSGTGRSARGRSLGRWCTQSSRETWARSRRAKMPKSMPSLMHSKTDKRAPYQPTDTSPYQTDSIRCRCHWSGWWRWQCYRSPKGRRSRSVIASPVLKHSRMSQSLSLIRTEETDQLRQKLNGKRASALTTLKTELVAISAFDNMNINKRINRLFSITWPGPLWAGSDMSDIWAWLKYKNIPNAISVAPSDPSTAMLLKRSEKGAVRERHSSDRKCNQLTCG